MSECAPTNETSRQKRKEFASTNEKSRQKKRTNETWGSLLFVANVLKIVTTSSVSGQQAKTMISMIFANLIAGRRVLFLWNIAKRSSLHEGHFILNHLKKEVLELDRIFYSHSEKSVQTVQGRHKLKESQIFFMTKSNNRPLIPVSWRYAQILRRHIWPMTNDQSYAAED